MKRKVINIFLIIISIFTITIPCYASTDVKDRNELDNYGVNKHWNITSSNKSNVLATPAVDASEKIYDYSDVLTDSEEEQLKEKIDEFVNLTNMDMVIVTTSFSYYSDNQNEDYAADFYDYNDFGIDFDNYSGVLLLRNTYEQDPYYDIYTFGNAQLYFSYSRLNSVLDDIYYNLHNEYYYDGFKTFINEMTNYYNAGIPSSMNGYKVDENGYLYEVYTIPWLIVIAISIGITAIVMIILIRKNKMVTKARTANEYLNRKSINITNRSDIFVNSHTTHYTTSSSSGGGGGGHSSGGSSGGGHSSGGGRHG